MTHEEIVDLLTANYPGAHWTLRGATYEGFEWLDDPATKPTAQQLGL